MTLLILGLLIWTGAHLFPAAGAYKRKKLMAKMGIAPYKAAFALTILSSLTLMVFGWRSINPEHLYVLPAWTRMITMVFVLITFILFVAAQVKTNIKRVLRHPQLTGLVFWSVGHLLANGDSRSLVLFGGLLIWAKLQIIFTNKRDGKRQVPEKVPVLNDVLTVTGGCVVYVLLLLAHPYFTGMPVINH